MGCIVHSFIVFEGTSIRNAPVIYGNLFENAYTFGENYQLEQQNVFIFEVESDIISLICLLFLRKIFLVI